MLKPRILVVDDEPSNLKVLKKVLEDNYRLAFATSAKDALDILESEMFDLILSDVMMPEIDGFELCKRINENTKTHNIPVIFVTALNDSIDEAKGLAIGAVDYIVKPIVPEVVKARIKTHLSLIHAEKLLDSHLDLLQRLGRAAEYKDNETGLHVKRMSHYCKIIAIAYGMTEENAELLRHAAKMHDIGKIGIPDSILLKPGKLTDEEFDVMKAHVNIGAEILSEPQSNLIEMCHLVTLTHHEKWNGTGYPNGLAGEQIPIEGRIVAIADVFDALTSVRPYKRAWDVEEALEYIEANAGSHFDPALPSLLRQELPKILDVKEKLADAI